MTEQTEAGGSTAGEQPKTWRPSRAPEHRADRSTPAGLIIERPDDGGVIRAMVRFIRRPFVKLVIGIGLFILAGLAYDATVNFGSWTERAAKPKATAHKRVPRAPQMP